jgi:hypothetical protein
MVMDLVGGGESLVFRNGNVGIGINRVNYDTGSLAPLTTYKP